MKKTVLILLFICCSTGLLLCLSCGNSAEVSGYAQVSGRLYEPDGKTPAAHVAVTLRPVDFLPSASVLGKRSAASADTIYTTMTNNDGEFRFTIGDEFERGVYGIEASDGKGNGIFIDSVDIDEQFAASTTILKIPVYTLVPLSVIEGVVPAVQNGEVSVYIFGLDRHSTVDDTGAFHFDGIPEGSFRIYIVTDEGEITQQDTVKVETEAGKTVTATVKPKAVTITYNGNGYTSGTVPPRQTLMPGDWAAIADGSGLMKNDSIFLAWNTEPDGRGYTVTPYDTMYGDGQSMTLYAQWKGAPEVSTHSLNFTTCFFGDVNAVKVQGIDSIYRLSVRAYAEYRFSYWKIYDGEALISDKTDSAALVTLLTPSVTLMAVFKSDSAWGILVVDSLDGYCSNETYSVCQSDDGGYVFTGAVYDFQDNAAQASGAPTRTYAFIMRTNTDGDMLWNRHFKSLAVFSKGYHVMATADGGFLMTGESSATVTGYADILLVKISAAGIIEWQGQYGGDVYDRGYHALETDDGYMVSGSTAALLESGRIEVLKVDKNGTGLWRRTYDVPGTGKTICALDDGEFVVAGAEEPADTNGIYLLGISSSGDSLWMNGYPTDEQLMEPHTMVKGNDGMLYITGSISGNAGMYVMTADQSFTMVGVVYDYLAGFESHASCLASDGGFVFTGQMTSVENNYTYYKLVMARFDRQGGILWNREYSQAGYMGDYGNTIIPTHDGGFVFAGRIRRSFSYGVQPVYFGIIDVNGNLIDQSL